MRRALAATLALGAAVSVFAPAARAAAPPALVWISAEDAGEVVAVDPATGTIATRIKVGRRPRGLRLSPDGKHLYVTLTGTPKPPTAASPHGTTFPTTADRSADGLADVDVAARVLLRTLPAGQAPIALALSPDGNTAFIANSETAEVTVLDLVAGRVMKKVPVGQQPSSVAFRPDGKIVYVAAADSNEVSAIDAGRLELVRRIDAGSTPRAVVFARDGARAFVVDETIPQITFLNAKRHAMDGNMLLVNRVATIFEPRPAAGVLSANGKVLFVACGLGQSILVVDVAARKVLRAIDKVGEAPRAIGLSRDGKTLFTANGPSNDVSIVDVASGKVSKRVAVAGAPWDLAVADR